MTDGRTGRSGEWDALELYAPLLASLGGGTGVGAGSVGALVDERVSLLVDEAVKVWSRPGFDTFLSVPALRFTPFDYQLQAARSALRRMRGRAILADEVGLGKTIEAGLILAELRLRGLAGRTLVITPAGLVTQWREELERKFGVPTTIPGQDADRGVLVASLAAARRDPLRSQLTPESWDLIIVDEAHRVRAPRSASGQLIRQLRSRYLLLLTATPVENRLQDLYEMVSLVAPGLLGTAAQFRAAHGTAPLATPGREPRNVAALRKQTAEVMIRHRRSEVSVLLPQRLAETVRVEPSGAERQWYADLTARVRAEGRTTTPAQRLTLRSVAKLAGSSPAAAAPTLAKIGWDDLARRASLLTVPAKVAVLLDRLGRFTQAGQKVLVFTAFRQTLELLTDQVPGAAVYHGSVLEAKINLFELVVGELDMILGRVDDEFDFETTVFDASVASADDAEFGERMAVIGDDLARARTDYLASRASIDNLVSAEEGV